MCCFFARSCQDSSSVVEVKKEADPDAPVRQTEESVIVMSRAQCIRLERHGTSSPALGAECCLQDPALEEARKLQVLCDG